MDATGCEHGNLELCADRWSAPWFGPGRRHQVDFGRDMTFCLSWEPLHTPHDRLLLRLVLRPAEVVLDLGLRCVFRDWNLDNNVRCKQLI